MNTIALVLVGYLLAKFQISDPIVFKIGIGFVLLLAALDFIGEMILKIAFKALSDGRK